ncbi:MAG TPA: AAA family ATPase [Bryobacteraceae bacterium]|nr:AAA family ATPase [Bryobacteraceae bacterium]
MPDSEAKRELASWLESVHRLNPIDELGGPIEIRQTHISVVLLGRQRVLKLKKPVDFGFLDYTTLEKRRAACEAEVRLNSRISPEVYLGIQPIREDAGVLRLAGPGPVVDYGVLMQRLPADRMLDEMIRRDAATEAIVDRVAARLAGFHRITRRGLDVEVYGGLPAIEGNWKENFQQTETFVGRTLSRESFDQIRDWVRTSLRRDREAFESRVRENRIVDGHGDVRCESVCIVDGITILDCIEFNERFRCGDVASEIAFLAMDLDALGRPDLGYFASERYQVASGDRGLWQMLPFYRCYRAYVRGKVLSLRLDQPDNTKVDRDRSATRASAFFDLARRYASRLQQPSVILVSGRSGTGKTALARAVAGELGLRVVSTDAVRAELFGDLKAPAEFGQGVYREDSTIRTYEALVAKGCGILGEDHSVVLDGTFLKERYRALAGEMAHRAGAHLRVIGCTLAPEETRQRIEKRALRQEGLSDATWKTYLRQREEPAPREARHSWLSLDTAPALTECSRQASDWLREHDEEG